LGAHALPLLAQELGWQPLQNVLFTAVATQEPVAGAQLMVVHVVEPLQAMGV
jgi:hypothetical protein